MGNDNLKQEKKINVIYNNLEFNLYYLDVNNFKQKQYFTIINIIGQSRLGKYMKLIGPANIYFDIEDNKHHYPIIMTLDNYNRNKTNCIVYHLPFNEKNDEYFDTLFIYYTNTTKTEYYGYLAYNSNTKRQTHRYLIGGDYNELTRILNEFFNTLYNSDLYNFYNKKYDSLKKINNLSIKDCPTIKDYNLYLENKIKKHKKYEEQ